MILGFNCQAEEAPLADAETPILAILHDDMANPLVSFQGKNVWAYRAMSPYSTVYQQLPQGARFIPWNEADMPYDPSGWAAYLDKVKAQRPDIKLVYGACNTANWPYGGQWPPDLNLIERCDFYATHVPTFATPEQINAGIQWPFAVTEVELDPNDPDIAALPADDPQRAVLFRQKLMAGGAACATAGAIAAFLWGQSMTDANAIRDPELIKQVKAFNANQNQQGGIMDEATQDQAIQTEMDRETHLAYAAYAMAKMLDKLPTNMIDVALQQEYREHINALDPANLTF